VYSIFTSKGHRPQLQPMLLN